MIYLAALGGVELDAAVEGPWREVLSLHPGLVFVDSDQHRSAVYHALKDHLPRDTPLLVVELDEVPKFKGMAPGALAWARARLPSARRDRSPSGSDGGGRPREVGTVSGQGEHPLEGDA